MVFMVMMIMIRVLGIQPRVLCMLGKYSSAQQHLQPKH